VALLTVRGSRITVATAASNLTLWLVLLARLRGVGSSQAQVSWQTSLAAFAFVRLLTVLPVTPGGLGITELGLIGILTAGTGHRSSGQVTAAVLLYRAVAYLPPPKAGRRAIAPATVPPANADAATESGERPLSTWPARSASQPLLRYCYRNRRVIRPWSVRSARRIGAVRHFGRRIRALVHIS
jgi:hypothetical protein